jgi:hypothetical protein
LFAVSATPDPSPPRKKGLHLISDNPSPKRFYGVWNPWVAVMGVVLHFVLRQLLDSWLNAPSDTKFTVAVFILMAPLLFSAYALFRLFVRPRQKNRSPNSSPPNPKESPWP